MLNILLIGHCKSPKNIFNKMNGIGNIPGKITIRDHAYYQVNIHDWQAIIDKIEQFHIHEIAIVLIAQAEPFYYQFTLHIVPMPKNIVHI